MFEFCQAGPDTDQKTKKQPFHKAPAKKAAPNPAVCQMFCSWCGQPDCNNGSKCGHHNPVGTYGHRKADQKDFGTTGSTHEAEHAVGFDPANAHNSFSRASRDGRSYENTLPAYQEQYVFHRGHIGTGNKTAIDSAGFNSASYRQAQQTLVDSGDFSTAVQINQLAYAFLPGFQTAPFGTREDQSFARMASIHYVPRANAAGDGYDAVPLTLQQKAEMLASREIARQGRWLSTKELYDIWEQAKTL